ncbi:MAG: SpoIIE family protein phosphatase [Fibromonadaceae bacterium]|nr:SpoIIE family protein phosphatase [Fibromonadaceae bacterium]
MTALPAVISFVKWRESSFKGQRSLWEFIAFFAFFSLNSFFVYGNPYNSYDLFNYIFKIVDPFFLLFLVQRDLSYSMNKKSQRRLLILMLENMFLQIVVHDFLKTIYIYNLLNLFTQLFSVYVVLSVGKEYYFSAYIPKVSRYLLIVSVIPCLLFETYFFRFTFISFIFYVCLENRRSELFSSEKTIENFIIEQGRFRNMMNELSNSIKDFSDKKDAAKSYLGSLCRFLSAKGAAIYEWDGDKKYFSCVAVSGLYFPPGIGSEKLFTRADLLLEMAYKHHIKDERSLVWKCGHNSSGVLLSHSTDNMEAILGNLSQEVHSIILVPLLQETDLLGVLVLENKIGLDYLTESDFNMARNFANFAAIILNTSRVATQKHENLRMSTELSSGNLLQSSLFLKNVPKVAGIDVSFFMSPAKEIGGDYYDFFEKGDKFALTIADVSGKGVSAGLIVAIMQTYLQNQYKKESDLKKLIVDLNKYLSNKITAGMFFATLLFFEWDSKKKKLCYVSCGHEHILHFHAKNKTIEYIRSGGLALMMDPDIDPYIKNSELVVEKGDSIILYTDGITETFNPKKEIFGLERLVDFFEKNPITKNTIEKLLPQTLENWRGHPNQTDDITCMLMQF